MQRIPKVIHYCWFGKNPYPELMQKCMQSWRIHCPDFELKEWNEDNFDISVNDYTQQAYNEKRWAFVSDYARLYALYTNGGVYMDTDVELLKPIDKYLDEEGFSGFEVADKVPTGIMGARKKHPFIKELLDEYGERKFILPDGTINNITNVEYITAAALRHGLEPNGKKQTVCNFTFYPSDYFCPIEYTTRIYKPTANTHAIHHFSGSWLTPEERVNNLKTTRLSRIFGEKGAHLILRCKNSIKKRGFRSSAILFVKKLIGRDTF